MAVVLFMNYLGKKGEVEAENIRKQEAERKAAQAEMASHRGGGASLSRCLLKYLKEPMGGPRSIVRNSSEVAQMGRHYVRNQLWKLPRSKVMVDEANLVFQTG